MDLRRKRAYDNASPDDGYRVLVDRLWPRGVSKQRASIDLWAKDVAPSTELRRAWHADGADDAENADRYRAELATSGAAALRALAEDLRPRRVVTLVYAGRDSAHGHVTVLEEALRQALT